MGKTCAEVPTPKPTPVKPTELIDGVTIKYHADGQSIWSRGRIIDGEPDGYWEWYRKDGTLKRSGHFNRGESVVEWITYDRDGQPYKRSQKANAAPDTLHKK